jgi:hypothetical protein
MDSLKLTFFGNPQVKLNRIPVRLPTRKALDSSSVGNLATTTPLPLLF